MKVTWKYLRFQTGEFCSRAVNDWNEKDWGESCFDTSSARLWRSEWRLRKWEGRKTGFGQAPPHRLCLCKSNTFYSFFRSLSVCQLFREVFSDFHGLVQVPLLDVPVIPVWFIVQLLLHSFAIVSLLVCVLLCPSLVATRRQRDGAWLLFLIDTLSVFLNKQCGIWWNWLDVRK